MNNTLTSIKNYDDIDENSNDTSIVSFKSSGSGNRLSSVS